ncbi:MAG: SUMF1/EgtB/PvdO family nonheme iron enzyme [Nitrospirae bacterium]|nr:SUMF1/EgtB/PvdO family nonheme iron enzyme [Nitrospirota bacterium]
MVAGKSEQVPEYSDIRNSGHEGGDFIFQSNSKEIIEEEIETTDTVPSVSTLDNEGAIKDPVTGMEFIIVKGGCYQMGDTFGDGYSYADSKPVHEVCVDDFYIGKYEVTQGQWESVMGNNPSKFKNCGDNCPVEQVSWNDIQEFIKNLNKFPLSKGGYRGML